MGDTCLANALVTGAAVPSLIADPEVEWIVLGGAVTVPPDVFDE
jgi:hypothetical protein